MIFSFVSPVGLPRTYLMRAADALASSTATYAIPLLVLVTTGSTALTGLAFLLEWAPRLAAFTFAGALVDRLGADCVFRASNSVRACLVLPTGAALLVLPAAGMVPTGVVLAFSAVSGLLAELSFVAVETLGVAAGSRLGAAAHRVQATQTGIDQGAVLVGPFLGGLLLLAGPPVMMAVVALLSLVATVTASGVTQSASDGPESSSLATGWRVLRRTPALVWLVVGLAASNLATGVLQAAAPITVLRQFHSSTALVGSVWSAAAVASLLAVWVSRRAIDRFGTWAVGAVAAALASSACLVTALAPTFVTYTVAVAVVMAGEGALTVVLRTLRSRLIPTAAFGSTLAVTILLVLVPLPLAGALVALVPPAGLPHLLLACSVLQGLVLGACFTGLRRHRAACESHREQDARLRPEGAQPVGTP